MAEPLKEYEEGKKQSYNNKQPPENASEAYMFGYREGKFDKIRFIKELEGLTSTI